MRLTDWKLELKTLAEDFTDSFIAGVSGGRRPASAP
jgi:hypothetical protein